jgi:putative transposase
MARVARVVVPRLPHHVTQRGNRRQQTFFTDEDFAEYRKLMASSCEGCGTQVWAYCLMPNHVHLIMVPDEEDGLRCAVAEAHRRYTRMINFRQGWRGHLWQERFHSFVMDEQHLLAAVRYVERNPLRAGLCRSVEDWRWSSARAHLSEQDDGLVRVRPLLKMIPDWRYFLAQPDANTLSEQIHLHARTGRPLGSEDFVKNLELRLRRTLGPRKPGPKPKPRIADTLDLLSGLDEN